MTYSYTLCLCKRDIYVKWGANWGICRKNTLESVLIQGYFHVVRQ